MTVNPRDRRALQFATSANALWYCGNVTRSRFGNVDNTVCTEPDEMKVLYCQQMRTPDGPPQKQDFLFCQHCGRYLQDSAKKQIFSLRSFWEAALKFAAYCPCTILISENVGVILVHPVLVPYHSVSPLIIGFKAEDLGKCLHRDSQA